MSKIGDGDIEALLASQSYIVDELGILGIGSSAATVYDVDRFFPQVEPKVIALSPSSLISFSADSSFGVVSNSLAEVGLGNSGDNSIDFSPSSVPSGVFLVGAGGNDVLTGSAGNDVLMGDDYTIYRLNNADIPSVMSSDAVFDRANIDAGVSSVFTLLPTGETNADYADQLFGGAGNDILAGGRGDDTLTGGTGDDIYFVEGSGDVIVEQFGEGSDTAVLFTRFGHFDYVAPEHVENIIVWDDKFTPSENVDVSATAGSNTNYLIVGNSGNNILKGANGNDVLIGGGDKDILVGGDGNDILYGGSHQDKSMLTPLVNQSVEAVKDVLAKYAPDAGGVNDVSHLFAGQGNDTLIGSSGDNDYFFIDVNSSGNNVSNVDSVQNFYGSGFDSSQEDYFVFSADQLGIDFLAFDGWGFNKINLNILGISKEAYEWRDDSVLFKDSSEEHFFKVDEIADYKAGSAYLNDVDDLLGPVNDNADTKPAFVLDTADGGLYFDKDGNTDYDDEVQVAVIESTLGDSLEDMHGNQILIVQNFDLV